MASFTITGDDTSARLLNNGETGIVTATGVLHPSSTPVFFNLAATSIPATTTLTNDGQIIATARAFDTTTRASAMQSLTIDNRGTVTAANDLVRIGTMMPTGFITIDNQGMMTTTAGRGVNVQEYGQLASFTFSNGPDAVFKSEGDAIRLTSATTGTIFDGMLRIENDGRMESTGTGNKSGQVIDLNDVTATEINHIQITNGETGVMLAADADAVRPGSYGHVFNYGLIEARNGTAGSSGNDAIDLQSNIGVKIDNYVSGSIIGARHGITGKQPAFITNDGTILARQGAGINMDTGSATVTKIANEEHGVITGTATASTDGDAIDVDGLIDLTNAGILQAVGQYLGGDGFNEALAIGGGTVINSGTITSDQRAIMVDNSDRGGTFAALNLTNEAGGRIIGGNGSAILILGDKADTITNLGRITGRISTDGGDDILTNVGVIDGDIDLADGADNVTWTGTLTTSQRVDGGAGMDMLAVDVALDGTMAVTFLNFEKASGQILGQDRNDVIDLSSLTAKGALKLAGGNGDDRITGGATDDTLIGGRGNDVLNGGAGKNVLMGGNGADLFILSTAKPGGGHDQIKDFTSGVDTLQIDTSVFTGLADYGLGRLDVGELSYGASARTADQHLIYNAAKGHLLYDADGVGGQAAVILAALSNHVDLMAGDIVLI